MDEEDSVYFVDQIIDKRYNLSSTEYLVKWTGWSSNHNTWEPDVNIIDTDLISAFEEKQRKKMIIADLNNRKKFDVKRGIKDQWSMPWFYSGSSKDNGEIKEPATKVKDGKAIAVEEKMKIVVGTKTYQSKQNAAKSAQKIKQVKLENETMNKITKKLKRSAAESKVPAKMMKTEDVFPRSG